MTASPLPTWLTTPYLVHVESRDFTIIREGRGNPAITSDHTITDTLGRNVPVLSVF